MQQLVGGGTVAVRIADITDRYAEATNSLICCFQNTHVLGINNNNNYSSMSRMGAKLDQDEFQSYKAAFDAFDWNHNGKISYASLQVIE
jgi:hypothetical protein